MLFDDCTLLISDVDPKKTVTILNSDLNKLSTWASKWKIKLNASKNKSIFFFKYYNDILPVIWLDDVQSVCSTLNT